MQQSTDTFGRGLRELRVSVTDRCNFRCGYCMPADVYGQHHRFAPREQVLRFEEIARVCRIAVGRLGVRKIRLTGGEPLTRSQLPTLVAMLSQLQSLDDLTLTTNGSLLRGQAQALRDAGLSRITVSLDALDQPTFARTSGGRGDVREVLRGIEAAERAGLWPIKINCVVQRGVNEHAVRPLARHFAARGVEVRFIEFMDVGTLNGWRSQAVVTAEEIRAQLESLGPLLPLARRSASEVAERYAYADGSGHVGIIASVTRPFCGGCTRARLSAEGSLLSCLFAERGLDLRAPLRSGEDDAALAGRMAAFWRARRDRYSEERAGLAGAERVRRRLEMYQVGG